MFKFHLTLRNDCKTVRRLHGCTGWYGSLLVRFDIWYFVSTTRPFDNKQAATAEKVPSDVCARKDSDQPAHSPSLIKSPHLAYFGQPRMQSCFFSYGQRRLWSDCAEVQSDLSLRWACIFEGRFSDVSDKISVSFPHCRQFLSVSPSFQTNETFTVYFLKCWDT